MRTASHTPGVAAWHSLSVPEPTVDLRSALDATLAAAPVAELTAAVEGLIARYHQPPAAAEDAAREDAAAEDIAASHDTATALPARAPILASPVDVLAYAAYRMPATHAAVRTALSQAARAAPAYRPASLLDLGGGTGAAAWAATEIAPSLQRITVLDQAPEAMRLGQRLARLAAGSALRVAAGRLDTVPPRDELPAAELVTISYVLGELAASDQAALVAAAAARAGAVVVVEPGTPAGAARVVTARAALLAAGLRVVAPCPHEHACPVRRPDWCHFAVRINRSALHRRVKAAQLGYEDEKFAYVVAVRDGAVRDGAVPDGAVRDQSALRPSARVLRRPVTRKGLVALRLCTDAGSVAEEIVSKRQGERYRAARDIVWGDPWPVS